MSRNTKFFIGLMAIILVAIGVGGFFIWKTTNSTKASMASDVRKMLARQVATPTLAPTMTPSAPALPTASETPVPTVVPTDVPTLVPALPAATDVPTATETPAPTMVPTVPVTTTTFITNTTSVPTPMWRVRVVEDGSYGPELELSRPGVGTSENEVATMVGYKLVFQTADGEVSFGGGCQQAIIAPDTYAWNAGGQDWGFVVWEVNQEVTETANEMAVLSFELAEQQVKWEDCEDLPGTELLDHVIVITQDNNNPKYVIVTPWSEFRRATGENHVLMIAPGDTFYGWHVGIGDSENNLCDGGGCYLPQSPTWGWGGGGIINSNWSGEIPADAIPVDPTKVQEVLDSLP